MVPGSPGQAGDVLQDAEVLGQPAGSAAIRLLSTVRQWYTNLRLKGKKIHDP